VRHHQDRREDEYDQGHPRHGKCGGSSSGFFKFLTTYFIGIFIDLLTACLAVDYPRLVARCIGKIAARIPTKDGRYAARTSVTGSRLNIGNHPSAARRETVDHREGEEYSDEAAADCDRQRFAPYQTDHVECRKKPEFQHRVSRTFPWRHHHGVPQDQQDDAYESRTT